MKRKNIIIGIIILAVIVIVGIVIYLNWSEPYIRNTNEELIQEYPALKNDEYLNAQKFSVIGAININEEIEELSNGKLTYIFNRTAGITNELFCTNTGEKAIVKEFYSVYPKDPAFFGGWEIIYVIECGNSYWVLNEGSSGWDLYGTFEKAT